MLKSNRAISSTFFDVYFRKEEYNHRTWETSLEESGAPESWETTGVSNDGPILTTKKPIWEPPWKPTHLEVLRTPKESSSRKSESKPSSLTLPSENAFESSSSRTVSESPLSSHAMVLWTTSKKTMKFSFPVSVDPATPSVISPVSDLRSSKSLVSPSSPSSKARKNDHVTRNPSRFDKHQSNLLQKKSIAYFVHLFQLFPTFSQKLL